MMARRGAVGLIVAAGSALLAGCGVFPDRYRYRMTVEVETPHGLRTGSAVREVTFSREPAFLPKLPDASSVQVTQRGEAVAVDLPGGKVLFALLSVNGTEPLSAAFGGPMPATLKAARASGRVAELPIERGPVPEQQGYPRLVTFGSLGDPTSVALVDPANLAASFGPGVKLRRITVQMTDEPVTSGIEKRLGWLADPHIMESPGWASLPYQARVAINGLFAGKLRS